MLYTYYSVILSKSYLCYRNMFGYTAINFAAKSEDMKEALKTKVMEDTANNKQQVT